MAHLRTHGWPEEINRQVNELGKPILGICLGMQLLAGRGTEGADTPGLNLIPGEVVRLDQIGCKLRIPHVGWNSIALPSPVAPLFSRIPDGTDFYFVHSYAFRPFYDEHVLAWTAYGTRVTAAIGVGHVFGTQFHPEKSSKAGFQLLRNFLMLKSC
jgi:glutamine amidotransferase